MMNHPKTRQINSFKSEFHLAVRKEYMGAFLGPSLTLMSGHKSKSTSKLPAPRGNQRNKTTLTSLSPGKKYYISSIIHCTSTSLPSSSTTSTPASTPATSAAPSSNPSINPAPTTASSEEFLSLTPPAIAPRTSTAPWHPTLCSSPNSITPSRSGTNPTQFQRIHEAYGPMARQLVSAHEKVMQHLRCMNLAVDAAARGAFVLDRDFDTMSRMVRRLHDESEHGRDVIRLFMAEEDMDGGWMMLREVARELRVSEVWFMDQLAELEQHVRSCFLNINRARMMVLRGEIR